MFVNKLSVATSTVYDTPGDVIPFQLNKGEVATPRELFAGEANDTAARLLSRILNVALVDFVTEADVPVIVRL
jgi:hypothetical protein